MNKKFNHFTHLVIMILICESLFSQHPARTEFLNPDRLEINPVSLVLTWNRPGNVLLFENFDGENFPPSGWEALSEGAGWQHYDTVLAAFWKIPENSSRFACSNDDLAGEGNDGSADLLLSPVIDLTTFDSIKLTFRSYFDGAYGQSAQVDYSTDFGFSWQVLSQITPSLSWETTLVDLTGMSGATGFSNVMFAFRTSDHGLSGSGWAVDDIELSSTAYCPTPENYVVFYDSVAFDTTTSCSAFIPTIQYTYGGLHYTGVCASYPEGNSDTITTSFISKYLFPPRNLATENCNKCVGISWTAAYRPPACWPGEMQPVITTPDYWTEGGSDAFDDHYYIVYEDMNGILELDQAGNVCRLIDIFGVPPLTDITHDYWGNFYGCNGTNIIYKMNIIDGTLIGQFTAPAEAHAIAFSYLDEWFYINNISSDITVFDENQVYNTFPLGNHGNIHSLAVYNSADDEGGLYAFSRDSTGAPIVEYDFYTGVPTGYVKDVSSLVEGGQAGGVFINYDMCIDDCAYLGGTIQNEIIFQYAIEENHCPGWTPHEIWGYYIYKDGIPVDSVEIICDRDWGYTWVPEDTLPQSHPFSVSAKFELDEFGLEDQVAFSELEGPVEGGFSYGYELDFYENWANGFWAHRWDTIGPRWEKSTFFGNPPPSACFRGISGNEPYSSQLMSYPFLPDFSESSGVTLSYDIRLVENETPTGNQQFDLELWDSFTREWEMLKTYSNDTFWDGFITESIDISEDVRGRTFAIRFTAHGDNPSDIQFWSVDNIRIERNCKPTGELLAEYDTASGSISLLWNAPYPETNSCIHYDDSVHFASAGFNTGPEIWCDVAARWENTSLKHYYNAKLDKIAFIPSDPETHYILKVWTGDSANIPLVSQAVSNLEINQWNTIQLDEPLELDGIDGLWIGYSFSTKGSTPVSVDAGPAADGYGNLCRIGDGEWVPLHDISPDPDGNINIQGYLHQEVIHPESYRVYKSLDWGPYQILADVTSNEYTDNQVSINQMHCYKVQSVCRSSPDTLASGLSAESCVLPVSTGEYPDPNPIFSLFPNPSGGNVNLSASEEIELIRIFDCRGELLHNYFREEIKSNLDLSHLKSGIYIIRVSTRNSFYVDKLVIIK